MKKNEGSATIGRNLENTHFIYWDTEYPEEGHVGDFDTVREAEDRAKNDGYGRIEYTDAVRSMLGERAPHLFMRCDDLDETAALHCGGTDDALSGVTEHLRELVRQVMAGDREGPIELSLDVWQMSESEVGALPDV